MAHPTVTCPVCTNSPCPAAWAYKQQMIYSCPHCGLEFISPMTSPPVEYYETNYQSTLEQLASGDIHPGFRYIVKWLDQALALLPAAQHRAIDIGCGSGYLLSELKQRGVGGVGLDFNQELVQFARSHYGVDARVGQISDLLNVNLRFDLALLVHVLEHVEQPLELLRDINRLLDPGGLLLIESPNVNRFGLRRSLRRGDYDWHEYPPHHLTFWSDRALAAALHQAGFEVLHCRAHPLGEEGQIQLFLKSLGWPGAARTAALIRPLARGLGLQGETVLALARRPQA